MLVLTRRREEKIVIGGGIEIVVLHIGHEGVKIGVKAPLDVAIYRGEIYEQVASENRAAAAGTLPGQDVLAALRRRQDRAEEPG